mmetsp:Transcript_11614/g.40028  ORF Transcript_11614/g.40028 Transcript_11614/m.40028 type:complete len:87 (+) Transcript_11614:1019-1279(+)
MIPEEFGEMSSLQKLDIRGNPIPTLPEPLLRDTSLNRLYTHGCPVHDTLKQQGGYAVFNERKIRRIKARGWPPVPDPGKLKGWGED